MNKLLSYVVLLLVTLAAAPIETQAQSLSKELKKEAKKAAKELVNDGWKVQGLGTIEGNMIRLMTRQDQGEILLVGASIGGYETSNAALANCKHQAATEYVQMTGHAIIQGRVTSQVSTMGGSESDNLIEMVENNFIKELEGELGMPSLKLIRNISGHEMQCWWLLNEDKMEKMRERAINKALKDVDDANTLGNKISDFIKGNSNEE